MSFVDDYLDWLTDSAEPYYKSNNVIFKSSKDFEGDIEFKASIDVSKNEDYDCDNCEMRRFLAEITDTHIYAEDCPYKSECDERRLKNG